MHTIYHTDAIITKVSDQGDASRRVWLFTRDLGLIIASVQGVRKSGAKLQMHLREYAYVRADLVRGRDVWRLVGIHTLAPILLPVRSPANRAYVRTLAFINRFLTGEDPHPELFAHISAVAASLPMVSDDKAIDTLALWRALALLGYIAVEPGDERLLASPFVEAATLLDTVAMKRCIAQANSAIAESHL